MRFINYNLIKSQTNYISLNLILKMIDENRKRIKTRF